jgi:hypothetical protein
MAQDRALELVAPADFMDRSFTQLDAMCLSVEGDSAGAAIHDRDTLLRLSAAERQGIICGRAQQIYLTCSWWILRKGSRETWLSLLPPR